MPESWLYSENGILSQEKYINSVKENDIIVKNKSKSSVKPPRKSKGKHYLPASINACNKMNKKKYLEIFTTANNMQHMFTLNYLKKKEKVHLLCIL